MFLSLENEALSQSLQILSNSANFVCKFCQILQTLFAKGPVNVLVGWAQEIYGIGRLGLWSRRQFL